MSRFVFVLILLNLNVLLWAGDPPNVVIITVDTLRADHLSGYGYDKNTSPNVDALMSKGVRFTNARTIEPLTAPALASMLTSRYPHEHGATRNGLPIYPDLSSLGKILTERGYQTAAFVGNWTLRDGITGLGSHFDEYNEVFTRKQWFGLFLSEATAVDLTDKVLDWLEDRKPKDKPFFLWVHYADPHAPYRFKEDFAKQVGLSGIGESNRIQRYDTEIAFTDHHIGRLLKSLDKHSKNTLTVFTSDHGESLGEHDYWGHGRHLYEATLHIPMAFVWDGVLPPSQVQAPALLLDTSSTLLGLLGMALPSEFNGYDWTGVMTGQTPAPRGRRTFYQAHKGAVQTKKGVERGRQKGLLEVAILENGVKEIFRVKTKARRVYDLNLDPEEIKSLVKKKSELSDPLKRWALEVEKGLYQALSRPGVLDDTDLEMLRSLGYIE